MRTITLIFIMIISFITGFIFRLESESQNLIFFLCVLSFLFGNIWCCYLYDFVENIVEKREGEDGNN
jgi:hypothetical protein